MDKILLECYYIVEGVLYKTTASEKDIKKNHFFLSAKQALENSIQINENCLADEEFRVKERKAQLDKLKICKVNIESSDVFSCGNIIDVCSEFYK